MLRAVDSACPGPDIQRVRGRIANNLQRAVRDLQRRKARGRRGLALLEGVRLVEEALAAGLRFRGVLVTTELERTTRGSELRAELERHAVAVEDVGGRAFAQLAATGTPQGGLAVGGPRARTAGGGEFRRGRAALVVGGGRGPGTVGAAAPAAPPPRAAA